MVWRVSGCVTAGPGYHLASDRHLRLRDIVTPAPTAGSQVISDHTGRSLFIEEPVLFKMHKSGPAGWDERPGPPGPACPQGDLSVSVNAVFTHT